VGPGVPNVLILGKPAAVATNVHACGKDGTTPLAPGSPRVLIGGLPALRTGDAAACGAVILTGAPSVLIG
jgi:uncharacterized Zn-binding protein involved in type VI secretion